MGVAGLLIGGNSHVLDGWETVSGNRATLSFDESQVQYVLLNKDTLNTVRFTMQDSNHDGVPVVNDEARTVDSIA